MLETGKWGEDQAATFLLPKGYLILKRNYRFQKAEIDIVAQKEKTIVAVEVKTRTGNAVQAPFCAINKTKQRNLIKAIHFFAQQWNTPVEVRMDAISVVKKGEDIIFEHLEDAFPAF